MKNSWELLLVWRFFYRIQGFLVMWVSLLKSSRIPYLAFTLMVLFGPIWVLPTFTILMQIFSPPKTAWWKDMLCSKSDQRKKAIKNHYLASEVFLEQQLRLNAVLMSIYIYQQLIYVVTWIFKSFFVMFCCRLVDYTLFLRKLWPS